MGCWDSASLGALAGAVPRLGIRDVAGRIFLGLFTRSGRFSNYLSSFQYSTASRVACDVLDCHPSCGAYAMDSGWSSGESSLARAQATLPGITARNAE